MLTRLMRGMMSKNLIARISVALVAIPSILWMSYEGGYWLFGMVCGFSMVGILEFVSAEGHRPRQLRFWPGPLGVAALFYFIATTADQSSRFSFHLGTIFYWSLLAFFLMVGMAYAIGKEPPQELFRQHARQLWGFIYIGALYPFVLSVGGLGESLAIYNVSGGDCLLFLFGLLWVGDTAAMGFGGWLGKHKLAPAVSPNKSVEGFVGGLVGALVVGLIMYFWKFNSIAWYHILIVALGCSVFGQLGDLVESMWKRSVGIKDSSALIPGHGGMLDRFDSLLFAAPFMYFYFSII